MGKIESFPSETLLMKRVDRLLKDGIKAPQMTVIANSGLFTAKSTYTGIHYQAEEMGPWKKFKSTMAVKSREEKAIDTLDLTEHERFVYRKALEEDQIVLYVEDA